MTIEQTINKQAKSQGEIIGFSQNQSAYQRWCITRHKRAAFVSLLEEQTGLDSTEDAHKDNQKSEMKKSEKKMLRKLYNPSNHLQIHLK